MAWEGFMFYNLLYRPTFLLVV